MSSAHWVLGLVCVAAAAVSLVSARRPTLRVAHGVMLAAMLVMLVAMSSRTWLAGAAGLMLVAGLWVGLRARQDAERTCGFDLVIGSGLMLAAALAAVGVVDHHAMSSAAARPVAPAVLAAALVGVWALARVRDLRAGHRPSWLAAVMTVSMAAMVLT